MGCFYGSILDLPMKRRFWFGHEIINKDTLDLISIGKVSEDNIQYYAVGSDFNPARI